MKNKELNFIEYWENIADPMHGHSDDAWPLRYAKEVLFYLKESDKIFVDTGCGTGDILKVLSSRFDKIYGIDFSQTMVDAAIESFSKEAQKPVFVCENMLNVHEVVSENVDVIFNNHSLQYLTNNEVEQMVVNSDKVLNEGGRIMFFNIPDKNMRWLYLSGFYGDKGDLPFGKMDLVKAIVKRNWNVFKATIKNRSYTYYDGVGYWFYKNDIIKIAESKNYNCEITYSIYPPYGYRFNAILSRK